MNLKIAIVGAGISGLTAGLSLRSFGFDVDIYEREENISEFGAGITLSRNATSLLREIDIFDKLANKSKLPGVSHVRNYSNSKVIATTKLTGMLAADRRDIVSVLSKSFIDIGGTIHLSSEIDKVCPKEGKIFTLDGEESRADLILACDGIKSSLRENYFDGSRPRFTNYIAWRGILDHKDLPGFEGNKNINVYYGPGGHAVHYPIGDDGKINFVGIQTAENWEEESWKIPGDKTTFLEAFKAWDKNLIKTFESSKEIYKWGVFDRKQPKNLINHRLVLLGDAAHPMVPFLGQGGCMAIEDAFTLALLLKKNPEDLSLALSVYEELRLKRTNLIQRLSTLQGRFNHVSNPLLVLIRNLITKGFISKSIEQIHSYNSRLEVENKIN